MYVKFLTIAALIVAVVSVGSGQDIHHMGAVPPGTYSSLRRDLPISKVDLYKRPKTLTETQEKLKEVAPELFRTEAVIVVFGAEWCRYCKVQTRDLKVPSLAYNVIVYDIEKDNGPMIAELLQVGRSIPVTMILEKGIMVKSFEGFTPWTQIKPHAEKAKKDDSDTEGHVNIGPINIDWDDSGVDINLDREKRRN
jgi:thiol-disulfide isomerase/thioredoxin